MGISTHILDTAVGRPASGVAVGLSLLEGEEWRTLRTETTDADGRCKAMLAEGEALTVGVYRLRFATATYYEAQGLSGLYPFVEIAFEVRDAGQHFHIPLLLTANGYTTYRGS
ncbi:hydroxyisourate hydrolase [Granulicella tundricola]|uniref:5-hydroxyisourate hydrolase n=1 Tax=Granulicella tundricola (strain ATCC BAA-1859 / DSM 23138 / MP5ACTX9) TaxID=1198114 RepID=E8WYX9_GRATM|nr:hydroxyisourate hydrolase [Granulicella tundricola]ADW69894.1 hydroxyisourate hydrolase [Granulicella tundricola MP5ACTX9]